MEKIMQWMSLIYKHIYAGMLVCVKRNSQSCRWIWIKLSGSDWLLVHLKTATFLAPVLAESQFFMYMCLYHVSNKFGMIMLWYTWERKAIWPSTIVLSQIVLKEHRIFEPPCALNTVWVITTKFGSVIHGRFLHGMHPNYQSWQVPGFSYSVYSMLIACLTYSNQLCMVIYIR